jgi:probable F420-dependent oxidoreductase
MLVDRGIGGNLSTVGSDAKAAERDGFDGVFTAETSHDPFFPLVLAAEHTERLQLGTGIAVAFARNPMNMAQIGWDLQNFSKGRFSLGLGSQIKPHITRRFSMPWSSPAARMREFVLAMRAIWASFEGTERLDFRGDFYQHTLMTPFFNPGPSAYGLPKVLLAAVGERMTEVVGEVCDGMLVHGFTTERYLREVTVPALQRSTSAAGRTMDDVELSLPAFVVTGADDDAMAANAAGVRAQIAFYGSTPAYRNVLDLHGWGDLQGELNTLSKQGRWADMANLIDDDILATFAVVAEPDRVATELLGRFGDVVQRISFYAPYAAPAGFWAPIVSELQEAQP